MEGRETVEEKTEERKTKGMGELGHFLLMGIYTHTSFINPNKPQIKPTNKPTKIPTISGLPKTVAQI